MSFELRFNSPPLIQHVNLRKEGAEHDILAVDVKVRGEVPGQILEYLAGGRLQDVEMFWHLDIEGHPARFNGITRMQSWVKIENCNCLIGKMRFDGVTAKKFLFRPIGGGNVEITFQIGISHIPRDKVGQLGELAQEYVNVSVIGEASLFDENEGDEEDDEAA